MIPYYSILLSSLGLLFSHTYLCLAWQCKCLPGNSCWPDAASWDGLNKTVHGNLIKSRPLAEPCYEGPSYNEVACARVASQWASADLHLDSPVGYQFPRDSPCTPIAPGSAPRSNATCSLGDTPLYTVNATEHSHVSASILFAKEYGLRLVIRNTGHDLLGRSTGFGGLQIWIRHLRTGLQYDESSMPSTGHCPNEPWDGSSLTIGGGYQWGDAYARVAEVDQLIVGGGTPTVGCIGGWLQGGGHSPASHDYGLGADQVLEAKVVLADGNLVTANACHNPSLFRAIRGGGPSAFGVVVSATWKTYPTRNVTVHSMTFAARTHNDIPPFIDALTDVYEGSVHLLDYGFTGFGVWSMHGLGPLTSPPFVTPTYTHVLTGFGKTKAKAEQVFARLADKTKARGFPGRLHLETSLAEYPTYAASMASSAFTNSSQPASMMVAYGSRLLDRRGLTASRDALRATVETIAGDSGQVVLNSLLFVGGGKVFVDQPKTAVLRAWRSTYVHAIVSRLWTRETLRSDVDALHRDITDVKVAALKKLSPDTGAYMNEADRFDDEWEKEFYGLDNYRELLKVKDMYDPDGVFYCPTCVGGSRWHTDDNGALCRA